ncbi:MAG: ribosome-binding factor A [Cytophagales bacterium]
MSSLRQQKYARLIQKELSLIFFRHKEGLLEGQLITIAEVKMSPDLGLARIYLSMSLAKNKRKLLDHINLRQKEIRKELGQQIRNQARIIPQLQFFIDEVEENAQRIEDLIKSLNIPKEDK